MIFDQVITNISGLRGVIHACLYKDGEQLASSFPDKQSASMGQTAEIIEQAFSALQSIQKSHNEIYFSVDNKYLAAFYLHESHLAILLTEKKINFPLIHMGIKSASERIKQGLQEQKKEQEAQEQIINKVPAVVATPTDNSILLILDQYTTILASFLGPAARYVIEDCVDLWKQKYVQNKGNLPHLVEYIQEELDSDKEKEDFAQKVKAIIE